MQYKDDKFIVYRHISPSGKSYIGITHQKPNLRWRSHGQGYKGTSVMYKAVNKYGWGNFKHEILFEDLTYEEACEKEKEMIAQYNSLVPNGYNVDEGGYSGTSFKRKIYGFDEFKNIKLFESITEAAGLLKIDPSTISHVIERPYQAGGMFFIYA